MGDVLQFDPNRKRPEGTRPPVNTPWSLLFGGVLLYLALEYVLRYVTEYTVTYALASLNCIAFLLIYKKKLDVNDLASSYYLSIKCNQNYRLLTSAFTHEHPLHLLCNMLSLSNIAPAIESYLGKRTFLILYMVFILIGGPLSVMVKKNKKPYVMSIGASGAICSVFGLLMVLVGFYQPYNLRSFIPTIIILFAMIFSNKIDNAGHFCGLFIGILTGIAMIVIRL